MKEDKTTKRGKKLIRSKSEFLFREFLKDMQSYGIHLNEREQEIFRNYLDNEFRQFLKAKPQYAEYSAFIKCMRDISITFVLNEIFRQIIGTSLYSLLNSFDDFVKDLEKLIEIVNTLNLNDTDLKSKYDEIINDYEKLKEDLLAMRNHKAFELLKILDGFDKTLGEKVFFNFFLHDSLDIIQAFAKSLLLIVEINEVKQLMNLIKENQ